MISTAKAIKKTREAQGMTQKELAERCGYTVTDIKAYELGEKEPKHINLMTIAGALGVTMYEMFERMEEIEEPENLNLDVIRNALSAHKAIVKTPLDKITVMAFEELIQYKETELTPDEIKYARESMKLELERRKTKMFEVKVDTETIKHVMDACKTKKTLNQHGVVIYNCLKELLEYKETGLTPQDIKEMDNMYLEKCQQVNKLTCTCEMYERMAKK